MIFDLCIRASSDRSPIIDRIKQIKNDGGTVIDVGGGITSFAGFYLDAIVDILDVSFDGTVWRGNITQTDVWDRIMEHVDKNGKYDFAICTHTLEDISNPSLVCRMLPKIAKEGFIATPNKFVELERHVFAKQKDDVSPSIHRGWCHHRWIFDVRDDMFIGYPKLGWLESEDWCYALGRLNNKSKEELNFRWKDSLEFKIYKDDLIMDFDVYRKEFAEELMRPYTI